MFLPVPKSQLCALLAGDSGPSIDPAKGARLSRWEFLKIVLVSLVISTAVIGLAVTVAFIGTTLDGQRSHTFTTSSPR
jgi:hypothetical protein